MKWRFTVSFELSRDDEPSSDETTSGIGGAGTHDFERDITPVSPDDRYNWEPDDRRLGFR